MSESIKNISDVVFYSETPSFDEPYLPDVSKIMSGSPEQKLENVYSDASDQFHCGVWSSKPGQWQINYSEHEFCYILKGKSVLHDENGAQKTLNVGDKFVIPAGFKGQWQVIEECEKIYVIFEKA